MPENLKIKMYKTIILPIIFTGLILVPYPKEVPGFGVPEDKILRKITETKKE
jgi:hypothetical protein